MPTTQDSHEPRFNELNKTTSSDKNHNNNTKPGYFTELERENFYLRIQLQQLLQELRAQEDLAEPAAGATTEDVKPSTESTSSGSRGCVEAVARSSKRASSSEYAHSSSGVAQSHLALSTLASSTRPTVTSNSLSAPASRRHSVQEKLQALEAELSLEPSAAQPRRNLESGRKRNSSASIATSALSYTSSMLPGARQQYDQHNEDRPFDDPADYGVAFLESKVEALERKYELQAAKHRELTSEIVRLRRHDQLEPFTRASVEVQTSPEESASQWPLPSADAVHGSPHKTLGIRRAASDTAKRAVSQFQPISQQISAGASSSSTRLSESGAGEYLSSHAAFSNSPKHRLRSSIGAAPSSDPQPQGAETLPICNHRPSQPGKPELIEWVNDRPSCRLFRAKYRYLPLRDSPNEHPELELTLEPGDYLLVQGDLDEDLFYQGELYGGERGLVPSNYVERVPDHELYGNSRASTSKPAYVSSASHPSIAPPVPRRKLRKGLSTTAVEMHRKHLLTNQGASANPVKVLGDFVGSNPSPSSPLPDSVCPYPAVDVTQVTVHEVRQMEGARVPCPRDLLIERQLAKSVVISWSPPENSLTPVTQYHVCVNGTVKAVVPGGYKTKALVEDLDMSRPHRISVRAVTETGPSSDPACTVTVGKDATVAPQEVRASQLTPVSVQMTWIPSNSNCEHMVLLNGLKVGSCPPGVYQVLLKGLIPSTMYRCAIRAKYPRAVLEEKAIESYVDFKTLPKIGLPDPPSHVQCELGPQDGTLLVTWNSVTNQPKPPSRAAVAGYMVYADGKKITEVNSPTGDHVVLRLSEFSDDPPLFVTVRTRTREGSVSADSNVVRVPRASAVLSPSRRVLSSSAPTSTSLLNLSPRHYATTQPAPPSLPTAAPPSAGSGGLLMVQPQQQPGARPPQPTATIGAFSQAAPPVSSTVYATTTAGTQPSVSGAQSTAQPSYAVLTLPAGGAGAAVAPAGPNQYYVFHPQLSRVPNAQEKPSLFEMENSYLVKHNMAAAGAPRLAAPMVQGMSYGSLPAGYGTLSGRGAAGTLAGPVGARALPVINPATGIPYRLDQGQTWHTLSPATRRRLQQYIRHPQTAGSLDFETGEALRRDAVVASGKRAAWKKRSYSADEELDYYAANHLDVYPGGRVAGLPHIRITGASGSEGPGSIVDISEEDWDYAIRNKLASRFKRRYLYPNTVRANSEPDLRMEPRRARPSRPRYFVSLYDYDPRTMSPNPNAVYDEISFRKGQLIKVYGEQDIDGFYRGEYQGRMGLIPGNMVREIDKEEAYELRNMNRSYAGRGPPPVDYDPYAYSSRRRTRASELAAGGWPQNSSDPALAAHYRSGYSDYESGDPDRYALTDPRRRRTKFQQGKSRSYDYADPRARSSRAPHADSREPRDYRRPGWATESDYEARYYSSGDRGYGSGPEAGRARPHYRGDPRDKPRDFSAPPARSPSEQEYLARRGRAYYEDPSRSRFDAPDDADREYYALRAPPPGGSRYDRRAPDARYYEERHTYDYPPPGTLERDRRKPPPYEEDLRRGAPDYRGSEDQMRDYYDKGPVPSGSRYAESEGPRDSRYPPGEGPRDSRYPPTEASRDPRYPPTSGGRDPRYFSGGGPRDGRYPPGRSQRDPGYRDDRDYAPQQPSDYASRDPNYYNRQQISLRRGGRDNLEQSIRDVIREAPARRMVAKFDYDPREHSPNVDAELVELTFRAGDIILTYGEMDEDGFYIGELGNKRGLVPSNFLEPYSSAGQAQQPSQDPGRSRREAAPGVTFSDNYQDQRTPDDQMMPQQSAAGAPSGVRGAEAGQRAGPPGAARAGPGPSGPKPAGAARPAMKKTDSVVAAKKQSDASAKASPGPQRKASQAQGPAKAPPKKK